jgi:NADP-dependent 3-hydroxy acid dehydrogenase YdfG
VFFIVRGIDERDRSPAGPARQMIEQLSHISPSKLSAIPISKLVKPLGIVPEPLPKLVARREFLKPLVEVRSILPKTTWPQSVDEDSVAVARRMSFVRSLQPNHFEPPPTTSIARSNFKTSVSGLSRHLGMRPAASAGLSGVRSVRNTPPTRKGRVAMGKTMLITGASSGIGAATARRAAQEGLKLTLTARRADLLEKLVREIGKENAIAVAADATKLSEQAKVFDAALAHWGSLDIVFANAGSGISKPGTENGDPEEWERVIAVNVKALLWSAKLAMPHLRKTKGHFVLTSSVAGRTSHKGSIYSASKWFAYGFGINLAEEMATWQGRCTTICPGMVNTPFFEQPKPTKLDAVDVADAVMYAIGSRWIIQRSCRCLSAASNASRCFDALARNGMVSRRSSRPGDWSSISIVTVGSFDFFGNSESGSSPIENDHARRCLNSMNSIPCLDKIESSQGFAGGPLAVFDVSVSPSAKFPPARRFTTALGDVTSGRLCSR